MNKQKGFTIIELIVVIAIIAVLAAIVLVNVTQYINKGRDAAIRGNLTTLLTNSAVYFESGSTYAGFKTDATTGCEGPIDDAIIGATSTLTCEAGTAKFCACAELKTISGKTFCVDSTGAKVESTATCVSMCASGSEDCQ
jgi:prepilin-type N-terminal cleavage/methylation domain-containing protein